ncbi:MAG: hypothetical protein L6437_01360 [Kiritimatiellae bacterium]|nr:hypothetical protein [Kiritimatiellia bacterium]
MIVHKHARIVEKHVRALSYAYTVDVHPELAFVIVSDFRLPPGWNRNVTSVDVTIPADYPETPPGLLPGGVLLPADLRKRGLIPPHFYPGYNNEYGQWAWWCYTSIQWNPQRDDLITLLERLRADMK